MDDIKLEREQIDKIDKEMMTLFEKRMECAKKIGKYKLDNNLSIFDKKREDEIIEKRVSELNNSEIKDYYVTYLRSMMDISKKYQESQQTGLRVAFSGVEGAFAHIAVTKVFSKAKAVGYPDFEQAYNSVVNGECDRACLPIENSNAGDVGKVMDLVFQGGLYINKIYELDIDQCLLGLKGTKEDDVKTIMSHPQALSQCSNYLEGKDVKVLEFGNTALAAKELVKLNDPTMAVIASKETASLYGLEIIKEKINSSRNNTTRFAIFSNTLRMPKKESKIGEHFIIVFTVKNEAGALAKMLNIIGAHSFNMRNLRSRPMKGLMWNYYFFVELEGNINSIDGEEMMKELKPFSDHLRIVGTYNTDN